MNKPQHETNLTQYSFVLWGTNFDETAAVIFATRLRRAGLLVKVVGLVGPQAAGSQGVAIHPDLTLSEATPLAAQTICLVIPCSTAMVLRLENDPRIAAFFQAAAANDALFVVSEPTTFALTSLGRLPTPPTHVVSYASHENLMEFARAVALTLKNRGEFT